VQRVKAVPRSFVLDLSGDKAARAQDADRPTWRGLGGRRGWCHHSCLRVTLSAANCLHESSAVVPLKLPPAEWSLLPVRGLRSFSSVLIPSRALGVLSLSLSVSLLPLISLIPRRTRRASAFKQRSVFVALRDAPLTSPLGASAAQRQSDLYGRRSSTPWHFTRATSAAVFLSSWPRDPYFVLPCPALARFLRFVMPPSRDFVPRTPSAGDFIYYYTFAYRLAALGVRECFKTGIRWHTTRPNVFIARVYGSVRTT